MAGNVQVRATVGNNMTLRQFAEILQRRIEYLNGSSRDSVAACALTALRSIRTVTKVAKASNIKVELSPANEYYPSCTSRSNRSVAPCLRVRGSGARYHGSELVMFAARPERGMSKTWHVWRAKDEYGKSKTAFLVAAPSKAAAKAKAKKFIARRALRYAGLAKRAISLLMMKTFSKNVEDSVPSFVTSKASSLTHKYETVKTNASNSGGIYRLSLIDELDYALDAVKGGRAQVDVQMKKAMNKIVSVINRKIKNPDTFFGPHKLQTPFPDVSRRR